MTEQEARQAAAHTAELEAERIHDEAEESYFLLYGRFPFTPRQPYGGDLGIDEDFSEQMERY